MVLWVAVSLSSCLWLLRNSILYKLKNLIPKYIILNIRLDLIISDYGKNRPKHQERHNS